MALTVLAARLNWRAILSAAADSQANPTASSKSLLKGALLALGNPLYLQTAFCTADSVVLHMYDRLIFPPRQIPHIPLADLPDLVRPAAATGTNQHSVPALAAHPQTQRSSHNNFVPVHPISRPVQYLRDHGLVNPASLTSRFHFPAQSPKSILPFTRAVKYSSVQFATHSRLLVH